MKSFQQFISEAETHDREGLGHGTGTTHRGDGKIGSERKKDRGDVASPHSKGEKPKPRMKAVGGGKTAPAKQYKTRTDAGTQRPKGRASERLQQPEKERGSAALSPKEAQRKAYRERKARESGAKTKTADQLLKKDTSTVDPKYKPTGKGGYGGPSKKSYTTKERKALTKKGERTLRDIRLKNLGKKSEKELKHKITSK